LHVFLHRVPGDIGVFVAHVRHDLIPGSAICGTV
jgi:hypothetical protein